jgi:hypothetical protein
MSEQTRTVPTSSPLEAAGGPGDLFGDDSIFSAGATVVHGVYREPAPANRTVGELRQRLRDRLSIDEQAEAFVDGRPVDESTVVRTGQTLTFMHQAGEKGIEPWLSA